MTSLSELTDALLLAAKRAGAEDADTIVTDGKSVSIEVRDGKLEHAERAEGIELGLRVLIGKRQASVSASDAKPETIEEMAERAVAMAQIAPEDPHIGLADPDQLAQSWDVEALDLAEDAPEPEPAALQAKAEQAEAAALRHPDISQVQSAATSYSHNQVHLAASNGFSGGYERTSHALYCVAIAGEGLEMERDHFGEARIYQAELPGPDHVGTEAAARAAARTGARKPKTGAFPVVFDDRYSASLVGHILQACNGAAVARGSSWLRDKLGEQILPADLSIIEDPHRVRVSASKPFDAEGLPTARRAIVDKGVLTGWTLDLATARQLNLTSTGNAARGMSSAPSPSNTNIALTEGTQSREDLLREMGTGLLVTSLIGSTVNPNTGDYSRGASGFWIENGEITYPVNECTIAGNLHDMLKTLRAANDARHHLSRVVPSLLVEGLTIAGE